MRGKSFLWDSQALIWIEIINWASVVSSLPWFSHHRVYLMALFKILSITWVIFIRINFSPNQGDWIFTDRSYFLVSSCDWLLILSNRFKIKVAKAVKLVNSMSNWLVSLSVVTSSEDLWPYASARLVSFSETWQISATDSDNAII